MCPIKVPGEHHLSNPRDAIIFFTNFGYRLTGTACIKILYLWLYLATVTNQMMGRESKYQSKHNDELISLLVLSGRLGLKRHLAPRADILVDCSPEAKSHQRSPSDRESGPRTLPSARPVTAALAVSTHSTSAAAACHKYSSKYSDSARQMDC